MELAADCSTMIPIKTMPVDTELLYEIAGQHTSETEPESRALDGEDETEDHYSITSVSPSPTENLKSAGVNSDDKSTEELAVHSLLVSPHPEDSLSNVGHHVSPLESIRELDEVDDQGSELHRSPGDGAVKVKEGVSDAGSPVSSVERNSGVGCSSATRSTLCGAGLALTFKSVISHDERAKLDTEMADLLKCPQGVSQEELHQTESLIIPSEEKWGGQGSCTLSGSRISHGLEAYNSSAEISQPDQGVSVVESLGNDLETSATSLQELQDLKVKHRSHQTEIERLCSELRDSRERIGELESELTSERKKGEDHTHKIPTLETEMSNSSLIAVLTECQSKVEQLEELKHSSLQLTAQLQAAQSMAAYLQRKMLCLEKEHSLKQQEVLDLTEQLEEARRALQEKSTEMARVTVQLQALQRELDRKQENGACSTDFLANGHATSTQPYQQPRQYSNDSKVCTLL